MHFLKIWVLCEQTGLKPSYEQKTFSDHEKRARLRLIGSRDGRDGLVDFCFGLGAPERFELNWIETNPDKGWFVLLSTYGPLEPILPLGWGPNDLPRVHRRDLFEGQ